MSTLIDCLNVICSGQPYDGILITGWFLSEEQLAAVRERLTPDVPPTGAIGRLLHVPVFPLEFSQTIKPDQLRIDEGVTYSCIPWPV
ncbi:hypothetical protein [Tuwongella immobilis]|uniref:Uncharacterized protein n=1 Tax=Tuwongella immobilis TaxID=692036 RepID=A0A6C2YI54_9BACT|nr:hypothetical protein [Tuwongella immobilis]VIP00823.1 unnamed protein product [Tuwongella immobilis]VTR97064.1 unnamed protein product [Tuwongella immobilis]